MLGVQSYKHFGCQRSQPMILSKHPSGALENKARRKFAKITIEAGLMLMPSARRNFIFGGEKKFRRRKVKFRRRKINFMK